MALRYCRNGLKLPPVEERPFGPTRQITAEERERCMAMLSKLRLELGGVGGVKQMPGGYDE